MYTAAPVELDDTGKFEEWKAALSSGLIKVFFCPDYHFPDHDRAKQRLDYRLKRIIQPTLVCYGGDNEDLDLLSVFSKDPYRKNADAFEEFAPFWHEEIDLTARACPKADIVAFPGNHTARKGNNSNYLHITTDRAFIDIIRSNGRVWWIPKEHIEIGKVRFRHGRNARKHEALTIMEKLGTEFSLISAHTHRAQIAYRRVSPDRVVISATSGCGEKIPPHYDTKADMTDWMHGVSVVTLDPHGTLVYVQNIVYLPYRNGELFTVWGNELVTSEE